MKVLFFAERSWCGLGPAGGAETMARDLMLYLNQSGHDTTAVVTSGLSQRSVVQGTTVYTGPDKALLHQLVSGADLVITHLGGTVRARPMSAAYAIPVVQLIHNSSHYSVGFLGDGCDYAIYNSDWIAAFHQEKKSQLMINVVNGPKSELLRLRRCFDWPSMVLHPPVMDLRILSIPTPVESRYISLLNLVPNKGPDVFYKLAEMNPHLQFMAVIGGYEEADQVIRDLPNVRIRDHESDVSKIYEETSIILMPSVYESYGRVAIEAAQYGIPSIVSPTTGLIEAMGPDGNYADRDDIGAWQDQLHRVLNQYAERQVSAYSRYTALADQSVGELALFEQEMRRVVDEWDS